MMKLALRLIAFVLLTAPVFAALEPIKPAPGKTTPSKPAPPPPRAANVPPAAQLDPVVMQWAVRASIAQGVAFLTNCATVDANGWVVPPTRTQRLIGHTNMVLRYSERAMPLYEYETYTVYERRPGADSLSARTLQPVTRHRVKRVIDPAGGLKHLVRDNNGPIVRETSVPVYDKTGPDYWPHGAIGQNAMALYALLAAGVSSREPVMSILADGLIHLVDDYGVPDATWDLAWLTAALSRWPGDAAKEAAMACASKLLDGQILDGDARGLWGPASINIPLLASAYQHEQVLAARKAKADKTLKEKPDNRARASEASDAASDLLFHQLNMKRIAMLAMAFDQVDAPAHNIGEDESLRIQVAGLPHYIFNQTTADIECTALAVFALREAADAKRLPRETWRPKMVGAAGVPRPEQADAILARTANALRTLQLRTGDWNACNRHQPVTSFNTMARMVPGLPVDPKTFVPLPSPQTPLSTLQGFSALVEIGRIVGFEKALGRFGASFGAGLVAARRQLAALPNRTVKDVVGGRVDPSEAYFFATAACDAPGTLKRELNDDWARMAFELVSTQFTNGAWQARGSVFMIPTSMKARMEVLPKRDPANPTKIMNRAAAHVLYNWQAIGQAYLGNRPVLATCHALLFLTSGAHPPFLTASLASGPQPMRTVVPDLALDELSGQTGGKWRHVVLDLSRDDPLLGISAPALFLTGTADGLADPSIRIRLSNYVMGGGMVIALGNADTPAGQAFFDALAPVIAVGCGGTADVRDVAGEQAVLGDLAGRLGRRLPGMTRQDGSLAALMLLLTDDQPMPATGAFSATAAARVVSTAFRCNLDETLSSPAYAHMLGDLGEPSALRASALQLLRNPVPPPATATVDAPAAPAAAATAAVPAAAAKPAPTAGPADEPEKPAPPPAVIAPPPPAADEVW